MATGKGKGWRAAQTRNAWLAVGDLLVDDKYERPLNARKVSKIKQEFDPDAIGSIYVSERDDGRYFILDGQHRTESVRQLWGASAQVPCLIYSGLTLEHEAQLYVEFNEHRTKPKPMDLFKAKITANDEQAKAIVRAVKQVGMVVGHGQSQVNCVQHLERIEHSAGEEILTRSLEIAVKAWGPTANSTQGPVLHGIAVVIARHRTTIDEGRLATVLRTMTPDQVVMRARFAKDAEFGGPSGRARLDTQIARLVVSLYNRNLRSVTKQLRWDDRSTKYWWTDETQMPRTPDAFLDDDGE